MKYILYLALPLMFATYSCEKTYSCKCTTTQSDVQSDKVTNVRGNKKDATKECKDKSITHNVINNVVCDLVK